MVFTAHGISKAYGGKPVLREVSFGVDAGEIVSLVGPSGVGKTTLLKIIAGLERADSGSLEFATPPSREHPVILVFQDYLLFPNLTVRQNVAFGLTVRRLPRAEAGRRVDEMLAFFQLSDKAGAWPAELSAGQRQRVAIARAMVVEPALLLLDEPFANLDRSLRMHTAEFIRRTQKAFGVPAISVTHDLQEAFVMSDRIGVLLQGELVQYDRADQVYFHPNGLEAARFLGPVNELPAALAPLLGLDPASFNGVVRFRPEAMEVTADPQGPGVVERAVFAGHFTKLVVRLDPNGQAGYGEGAQPRLHEQYLVEAYAGVQGPAPGERVRLRVTRPLPAHEKVP